MSQNTQEAARAERIAQLNDHLRICNNNPFGSDITVITHGLNAAIEEAASDLTPEWFLRGQIRKIVAEFDDFTPDNDPYGERDFATFSWNGIICFWKIEYYNTDLTSGSPDPADPGLTSRVLTIGRFSDW